MGNSNKTFTFIGGSNTGNLTNSPKQTATLSVPITASNGVNPSKMQLTPTGKKIASDYLFVRNTYNLAHGNTEFRMSDYESYISSSEFADMDISEINRRGLFTLGKSIFDKIIGTVSMSAPLQDLVNKGLTRVSSLADSTLGEGVVANTIRKGLDMETSLKPLLSNLYASGKQKDCKGSGSASNNPMSRNLMTKEFSIRNSDGYNNILPPSRPSRPTYSRRGKNKKNCDPNVTIMPDSQATKLVDNLKEVLNNAQNAIDLPMMSNNDGDAVYVCPASALISGEQQLPFSTVIDGVTDVLAANYAIEQHVVRATAVLASTTGSTTAIAMQPNQKQIERLVQELEPSEIVELSEQARLVSTPYGFAVGDKTHASEPQISSEIVQDIINTTPLTVSEGARVSTVERSKEAIRLDFPTDNFLTEALIANPNKISLLDLNVGQYFEADWTEVVDTFANAAGYGTPTYVTLHQESSMRLPTNTFGFFTKDAIVKLGKAYNVVNNSETWISYCLPANFSLKPVYSDYSVNFTLKIFYGITGELDNSNAAAGLIIMSKSGKSQFIPITPDPGSRYQGSVTFNSDSLEGEGVLSTSSFKASGQFSVMFTSARDPLAPVNLSIVGGVARLTRRSVSQRVNSWIVNGKESTEPFASNFFLLFATDVQTSHPFDVIKFWQSNVVTLFNPYLSAIVDMLGQPWCAAIVVRLMTWINDNDYLGQELERGEFLDWLEQMVMALPNWMQWAGESPCTRIVDSSNCPVVMFEIFKTIRALVIVTPYEDQNISTLASAMDNVVEDPVIGSVMKSVNFSSGRRHILTRYSQLMKNKSLGISIHALENGLL